jgi:hypothetical protein
MTGRLIVTREYNLFEKCFSDSSEWSCRSQHIIQKNYTIIFNE